MTTDDIDRMMLYCIVCGRAWDEHGDQACLRYKPKYVTAMETLRAENARLLIELEGARGELFDLKNVSQDFRV